MEFHVNVLVTTFPGLSLPPTLCLPLPADTKCHDLLTRLAGVLPREAVERSFLTAYDNQRITPDRNTRLSELTGSLWTTDGLPPQFVNLRLHAPLVGGKGGFGSQLRAAGGRMSSKKRRQNAELASGSARNLDGRRLRTITEAKNLATYLATKPEMDRKEKEERRKRWEQVIELAEQREADMRAGKTADGRRKGLSEEWIQDKEDVGDSVKNAVKLAMAAEQDSDAENPQGAESDDLPSDSADEDSDEDPMELDEDEMLRLRKEAEAGDADALWVLRNKLKIPKSYLPKEKSQLKRFAGFDDDLSSDEEDGGENNNNNREESESLEKGKTAVRG